MGVQNWTVYETVSCIQQLHTLCIGHVLLHARFVIMPAPSIKLSTICKLLSLPLSCTGYNFLLAQKGEQEYTVSLFCQVWCILILHLFITKRVFSILYPLVRLKVKTGTVTINIFLFFFPGYPRQQHNPLRSTGQSGIASAFPSVVYSFCQMSPPKDISWRFSWACWKQPVMIAIYFDLLVFIVVHQIWDWNIFYLQWTYNQTFE